MLSHIRIAVASGLIALFAWAAPTAVHASSDYPPVDSCESSDAAVAAGAEFVFSCQGATFGSNEPVTVTVTGQNATSATFAFVRFGISTLSRTYTSTATGALEGVRITLPPNGSGIYNIAAVSPSSVGGTTSVSIVGADGLPTTGGDSAQLVGVWIGGGALLLAGVVIIVAVWLRRRAVD